LFKEINDIPGVHNVTLSYHNFEDINEDQVK
jgi:nitrate reductase NapAB chaperone NapD